MQLDGDALVLGFELRDQALECRLFGFTGQVVKVSVPSCCVLDSRSGEAGAGAERQGGHGRQRKRASILV